MILRIRSALALCLVALSMGAAACTGDGGDETIEEFAAEREGSRVTLTDDSCTYEGARLLWSGHLVIEVVNERDVEGFVEIVRIAEGATFADLEEYISEENERVRDRREPLGEPSFVSVVASRELPAKDGGPIPTELGAGQYAALCVAGSPLEAIYVAAPLQVAAVTVTLTDDSCEYEGPRSVRAGHLSIGIENEGDSPGRVEILRIEGSTFDDVVSDMARQQERLDDGKELTDHSEWISVGGTGVPAGSHGTLRVQVVAGDHALTCDEGSPPAAVYAAAPLDVVP